MLSSSNISSANHQNQSSNPLNHLMENIFSYNGNIMIAAIVSLLLCILFVLVLHVYAKWFLAHANHRRRSRTMTVSTVLGSNRFHQFPTFAFDITTLSNSTTKGLDPSIISSIPLFLNKTEDNKHGLECVICLSGFEENEIGKNLPNCGHSFHVECIDMWLGSHSNCPICRTPVVSEAKVDSKNRNSTEELVDQSGGVVNGNPDSEIVIDFLGSGVSGENLVVSDSALLGPSSSSSFSCSLKKMLSKNWSENKVFPASTVQINDRAA